MGDYVHLHAVSRRFGEVHALDGVEATVRQGELLSFVGPSGAGKTTLLRLLAGLDDPSSGWIERSRPVSREHPAILVFQDYLLFPHMTVFDNVAFGLRSQRRRDRSSREDIRERVMRYLDHLGIADKAGSWPAHLSGGQRQRVALARALVMEPDLLLLDEPFANLDKTLKRETARFIRRLQADLGVTTIVVSHDLEEAAEVSDRIGVIIDGRLRQLDSFERVYFSPTDLAVARLFGPVNVIPGRLLATFAPEREVPAGAVACARPESLDVVVDAAGAGTVREIRPTGGTPSYLVEMHGWSATVRATGAALRAGTRVSLRAREVFVVHSEEDA